MRILTFILFVLICFTSCIPTRIAPKIETNKVMLAKKFKRKLPKQHAFIFEDPKSTNHFYNYINTKYQRNHINVEYNVPFKIDTVTYYLSFYETEIEDRTLNFVPILIDAALTKGDDDPYLEDVYESRKGNYYLVLTVSDDNFLDCLSDNYKEKNTIIQFLENIRIEYLNMSNYEELLFKKKS